MPRQRASSLSRQRIKQRIKSWVEIKDVGDIPAISLQRQRERPGSLYSQAVC